MQVRGTKSTEAYAECPCPSTDTLSDIRKRLLVLHAGTAATWARWPGRYNNAKDWVDIYADVATRLRREVLRDLSDDQPTQDAEANLLIESARNLCDVLAKDSRIRAAIDQVAKEFDKTQADFEGYVRFQAERIIAICESTIGEKFRAQNPWSSWLAGGVGKEV